MTPSGACPAAATWLRTMIPAFAYPESPASPVTSTVTVELGLTAPGS